MAAAAAQRARRGGLSVPDRLSALPDELLRDVLSFLPAQQVVQTTVLSKRWTDLWRSVPGINLDLRHFQRDFFESCPAAWERMENFANNLLILHNAPCLDAFRFHANAGNLLMQASVHVLPTFSSPIKCEIILLGSLFNVTNLELKGFRARAVLNKEFNDVPVFDSLRTLSLVSCFSTIKECALWRFMQKSPYLEKLILKDFHGASIVEPAEYPTLENLRTLILDKCSLHDNFLLLHHWLRNSPNLEKLSVRNCKLPDGSTGGAKKTYCRSRNLVQFPKLICTEITHGGNHANIPEFVRFLLDISAPHNAIMVKRI
nr:F-box/FBD/LRR-repeat protein At5g56420-like [Setaria viridis]